jgi:G3E family GTPase
MQAVAALPRSIFRLKGLIDFADSSETMLFQYVAGRFELSVFPHPSVPDRFLTVIGKGTDPQTKGALDGLSMVVTG